MSNNRQYNWRVYRWFSQNNLLEQNTVHVHAPTMFCCCSRYITIHTKVSLCADFHNQRCPHKWPRKHKKLAWDGNFVNVREFRQATKPKKGSWKHTVQTCFPLRGLYCEQKSTRRDSTCRGERSTAPMEMNHFARTNHVLKRDSVNQCTISGAMVEIRHFSAKLFKKILSYRMITILMHAGISLIKWSTPYNGLHIIQT